MDTPPTIPPEESLIQYPCDFPIKVMGPQAPGFAEAVVAVARQFDTDPAKAATTSA